MQRRPAALLIFGVVLMAASTAPAQSTRGLRPLVQTDSLTLKPYEAHALEFSLDDSASGKTVAVAFRAFAVSKKASGYRGALHVTVNHRVMRARMMKRNRLLNKRVTFNFGDKGQRQGVWAEDSRYNSAEYKGSAVWLVPATNSLEAFHQSGDYAPRRLKDPAATVINITDLVQAGRKNVVHIQNIDPQMTIQFDVAAVLVGTKTNWPTLEEMEKSYPRKSARTYYTDERIAAAKENLKRYDWARADLQSILKGQAITYYIGPTYAGAEKFGVLDDEQLWLLMPTTTIARRIPDANRAVCPVHGTRGRRHNPFCPWRIDPLNHPYQIQCMEGDEWYPSNAYHKGDMTGGKFPDNGDGCTYQGKEYHFLREYTHMVYGSVVVPALNSFSQAYILTGEKKYAHQGCVLLARLASEYPNVNELSGRLNDQRTFRRYKGARGGMITDYIWSTFMLEAETLAYDALFDYMDEDPELLTFLQAKGLPVKTADDLRRYIEDRIIRPGMTALIIGGIRGNEGHHQAVATTCALVIDDFAAHRVNTQSMADYYYYGIGQAADLLTNGLTPDGGGHESPNYGRIKLDMVRAAKLMEEIRRRYPGRFPEKKYPDIFAGPKGRALFDYYIDIQVLDYWVPSIGDCGGISNPSRTPPHAYSYRAEDYLYAFQRYGDPRFARACTKPDGADTLVPGNLFEPYPETALKKMLAAPESKIIRAPRFLDDYGVAILETHKVPHRRAVYLNYASTPGHRQLDNLAIGLYARGVNFLPDLGYPYSWRYRWTWDSNSMTHNTVTVDETQPAMRWNGSLGGPCRLFASEDGIHLVTAGHDPYPADYETVYPPDGPQPLKHTRTTDLYERTLMLVDVDAERFYAVDLFAVRGGEQHDQSWHGPLVPVQPPKLDWQMQTDGTLAGATVKQFSPWTDRWGRKRTDFPCFLAKIRRTQLEKPAAWTWPTRLAAGDTLRMHIVPVGGPMEILQGIGRSPARDQNWGLDYIIARRLVKPGGSSRFLTVLDAFQKEPVVQSVRLASVNPITLVVVRADGEDTITLNVPDGPGRDMAHRPLGVRVQSTTAGKQTRDLRIGACGRENEPGYLKSVIRKVDYTANRITLPANTQLHAALEPDRALRIFNEHRSAMYRVRSVIKEDTLLQVTLDRSAFLAHARVKKISGRELTTDTALVFATGRLNDGKLIPGRDAYRGCRLGEGLDAAKIHGIVNQNRIFLTAPLPASARRAFTGNYVPIYQYGPDDHVEIALIAK